MAILIDFGLIVPDGDKQLPFMDGQDVTEDDLVPWHMVIMRAFCDHPNQTWRVGICNLYMPVAYANYGCMVICAKAFKMSHLVIYFIQDCTYKSIPYASSFFLRSSCNGRFFMTSWNGMS